jgi:beta-xylosidase
VKRLRYLLAALSVAASFTGVAPSRASASLAVVASGVIDGNTSGYIYAPAFVVENGQYRYYACGNSGGGDVITYKTATTFAGLSTARRSTILSPSPDEVDACDPSVVKGPDGRYFLHYSVTPSTLGGTS